MILAGFRPKMRAKIFTMQAKRFVFSRHEGGSYHAAVRIYGISSCYTSVNWDAISSEAYFRQLIDLGCLFIWYFHYMPVGNDAAPSRQPPQPRRSKERAQKANTRKNTKKQRFPFGKRCFSSLPRKQKA